MVSLIGAFALASCAIFWPSQIEPVLRLRLAAGLLSLWCACFSLFLYPEFRVGFTRGIREFCKAVREILDHDDHEPRPS